MERKIKIGNTEVYYKDFGEGKASDTIVILHGWGGSSNSWNKVAEELAKHDFRIIIPDLPGFGKTKINRVFSLDDYAIFIENFIKELNLGKIILWGHSNGGAIAIKITNRGKLNIDRLVLNNSAGIRNDSRRKLKRKILGKIVKPFRFLKKIYGGEKIREVFYKLIGSHDYINSENNKYLKETYLNMIKSDLKEDIKNISLDTLLIWGVDDTYTPLTDGNYMRNNIKKSRMVTLHGEKHGIHLKSPKKLVNTFLDNV